MILLYAGQTIWNSEQVLICCQVHIYMNMFFAVYNVIWSDLLGNVAIDDGLLSSFSYCHSMFCPFNWSLFLQLSAVKFFGSSTESKNRRKKKELSMQKCLHKYVYNKPGMQCSEIYGIWVQKSYMRLYPVILNQKLFHGFSTQVWCFT